MTARLSPDPSNGDGAFRRRCSRRQLLRLGFCAFSGGAATLLAGCQRRIIEIERLVRVEREVTRVVTEIVRETVVVKSFSTPTKETLRPLQEPKPTAPPPTELRICLSQSPFAHFAAQLVPTFEEIFAPVRVSWDPLGGWSLYGKRVLARYAAGDLGDIIEAAPGWVLAYWDAAGIIQPLDDLLAVSRLVPEGLFRGAVRACQRDGRQMALPFLADPGDSLLLGNVRMLAKAGIRTMPNWTLNDLAVVWERFSSQSKQGLAYVARPYLPVAYPLLHLFDAYLFTQDGRQVTSDWTPVVEVLSWLSGLAVSPETACGTTETPRGALEMLISGQAALSRYDFATWWTLHQEEEGLFSAVVFPSHPLTGHHASLAKGRAFCLPVSSRNKVAALEWMQFMLGREIGVQMFLGGYAPPGARAASWTDPRVLQLAPICAQLASLNDQAQAERLPKSLRVAEVYEAWNATVRSVVRQEQSIEEAVESLARRLRDLVRAREPLWNTNPTSM